MQQYDPAFESSPPDCFLLEELQAFQRVEACALLDVNYYLWLSHSDADRPPHRFLFCLELVFDRQGALLLSSGEDSTTIRVISAESLIETARGLQKLHDRVSIQRVNCETFPLWQPAIGAPLQAVRLSRNEAGLYLNDALVLDFGGRKILVSLGEREGLELGEFGRN